MARNLIDAAQGRRELLTAIRDHETQMIDYGFAAVRLSMRTAEQTTDLSACVRFLATV